jgi:hypothetical protein
MKQRPLIQTLIYIFACCAVNQLSAQETQTEKSSPMMVLRIEKSDLEVRFEPGARTNAELKNIETDLISSVSIFKGDSAILKYGPKAKDGVIVIYLKQSPLIGLPEKYRKMFEKG